VVAEDGQAALDYLFILTKPYTANQLLHALRAVLPAPGPGPHASP